MKSYLRFLGRNKLYTAIMAVGLSVSLAFVIIFTCYVRQQFAVCNHYPDSQNIYLVGIGGNTYSYFGLADEMEAELPEVAQAVTIQNYYNAQEFEGAPASKEGLLVVGRDFFEMFSTDFIYGSLDDFNNEENALVTESFASRHGMENVIGKKLIDGQKMYTITGIIEDFTGSVFDNFEVVVNAEFSMLKAPNATSSAIMTFVKVKDETDITELQQKICGIVEKFYKRIQYPRNESAHITRLDKLYFADANNGMTGLKKENSDKVFIFCLVVLFLLVSAIINYVNLSVASSEQRAKEMALRNILGAEHSHMRIRTLAESFMFIAASFIVAIVLAYALIGWVNDLLHPEIPVTISFSVDYLILYCLLTVVTSLICGLAVFMATSKTKVTSSTNARKPMSGLFLAIQFMLSFIMITISITMEIQMKHMVNREMNANVDGLYRTNVETPEMRQKIDELPFVKSVGKSTGYPGYFGFRMSGSEDNPDFSILICDSVAFRLFGFEKIEEYRQGDPMGTWMCESAARHYNINKDNTTWPSPGFNGMSDDVCGIIKDCPVTSVLKMDWDGLGIVCVVEDYNVTWGGWVLEMEESPENKHVVDSLVSALYFQSTGREIFNNGFIKDLNKAEYDQTRREITLIEMFMLIAILLSCLAFLAMSMHYAVENKKSVAVNKVFGGNTSSEVKRCMKRYFKIMLPAVALGIPLAWFICKRYLEQFSYRIEMNYICWIILVAVIISLLISSLTVLWQTLCAASTNPAEALKKE